MREKKIAAFQHLASAVGHAEARHDVQPRAKPRAPQSCFIRSGVSDATRRPKLDFDTVTTLCRFMAHGPFIPSASFKATSDGIPRMVEVMGATVTVNKYAMALSLVSTTTGRGLSGLGN